jgi:hypothetical protein
MSFRAALIKTSSAQSLASIASGVLQRKCACGGRKDPDCTRCYKPGSAIMRRPASGRAAFAPALVQEVLRSSGEPLDSATRAFFEPRFGHDFSKIRIHHDARASQSATAINALAYTAGRHIILGALTYAPDSEQTRGLLAHELTHAIQQQNSAESSSMTIVESADHEHEAEAAALAIGSRTSIPVRNTQYATSIFRQKLQPDEIPRIDPSFELDPHLFILPMDAPAVPEKQGDCEQFPGGSTDCEVDQSGTPTGKVTQKIDETNPCTRPCVEQHEAVHVKQLKTFCPQLRDCYRDADRGKRPIEDCVKMAIFGSKQRECEAYKVSVPCVEKRLKEAAACHSKENQDYGTRKLASEKCFREKNCSK